MSDNKTIDNVHVEIYGHEMLSELITRARKNNIPYDKEMKYDFHSHGHSYLVFKDGELTLLEDPTPSHYKETSLNYFFELYLAKEVIKPKHQIGKWYKHKFGILFCVTSTNDNGVLYGYGFDKRGSWFSFIDESSTKYACNDVAKEYTDEATAQEVEKALIEEAKRRYKVGDRLSKIRDDHADDNRFFELDSFSLENNCLYFNSKKSPFYSYCIFQDGQWATIIEQDNFAELKEAHRNGAVIQLKMGNRWFDCDPVWTPIFTYRIKPEEGLKIGDKVIGIRTDCAIIGEVTSVSKKKVCVNNLAFLKDQVSPLTAVQYDDVRFLINGLKGHD